MSAFNTLLAVCLVVIDLVAVVAAFAVRAESAARLRAWARSLAISAFGLIALSVVAGTLIAIAAPFWGDEPTERATLLAHGISQAMNGVAMAMMGAVLPLLVALVFRFRASRRTSTEP